MTAILLPMLSLILAGAQPGRASACVADRARILALDKRAFDQDLEGGWRAVADRPGCEKAAADLIRDYRTRRSLRDPILFWHEGQLRASAGQTGKAVALFEKSRQKGAEQAAWNHYVDATIAFLKKDRNALLAAREALARLPKPPGFAPRDPQGRPLPIAWPMNLNVVDGLIACYGKSYAEAYGPSCTRPMLLLPR